MAKLVGAEWKITDHVCRVCFGRVLLSATQARCADCGASGRHAIDVCACGVKLHSGAPGGLKCLKNPAISIECPAEIVIRYVGYSSKPENPVKPKHYGGGLFDAD